MPVEALVYIPVVGLLARSARLGGMTEKTLFIVNLVLLWITAIWFFGYPAIILPALTAAISYLAFLVVLTSGDLFNASATEANE